MPKNSIRLLALLAWLHAMPAAMVHAAAHGQVFFQRVISAKLIKGGVDEAIVQGGLKELPTFLGYLERELGRHGWLISSTTGLFARAGRHNLQSRPFGKLGPLLCNEQDGSTGWWRGRR